MPHTVRLRNIIEADLPIFFEHQRDPLAYQMVGFAPRDATAFMAHWQRILADSTLTTQAILRDEQVAGNIACFLHGGEWSIGYWLGREFWGNGIATAALQAFLEQLTQRPLTAYVATHNHGSRRVLEKCGFVLAGEVEGEYRLVLA